MNEELFSSVREYLKGSYDVVLDQNNHFRCIRKPDADADLPNEIAYSKEVGLSLRAILDVNSLPSLPLQEIARAGVEAVTFAQEMGDKGFEQDILSRTKDGRIGESSIGCFVFTVPKELRSVDDILHIMECFRETRRETRERLSNVTFIFEFKKEE